MVAFSIQVKCTQDDDCWLNDTLTLVREGLQSGFASSHAIFYGSAEGKNFITEEPSNLLLTPYQGRPVLGEDYHHLRADDHFAPMLQEYGYVLCDNRLTSCSKKLGKYGWLPAMPRQRKFGDDIRQGDMYMDGLTYHWASRRRPIAFERAALDSELTSTTPQWLLYKTWGEYFDHMVTRKDTIRADIFVYPDTNQPETVTICGLVFEFTSTKEFATVESEVYAGAVFKQIKDLVDGRTGLWVSKKAVARLFYPRISFWDIELVDWAEQQASLPSAGGSFPRQDLDFIRKSLSQLPNKKLIPNATADFGKKLKTLAAEYAVTAVVGLLNFSPTLRDFVTKLLQGLF